MTRSLLNQMRTKAPYKLIDSTLLDSTTKRVIYFLKHNKEFKILLESHGRLIDGDLLLNGSASTPTGTEKLVLIRQTTQLRPALFHIYRNERKDLILTKEVAEVVKQERKEAQEESANI